MTDEKDRADAALLREQESHLDLDEFEALREVRLRRHKEDVRRREQLIKERATHE